MSKHAAIKTKNGYAFNVTCHIEHSGNAGLVKAVQGWWQCQGCGNFVAEDTIKRQQPKDLGNKPRSKAP